MIVYSTYLYFLNKFDWNVLQFYTVYTIRVSISLNSSIFGGRDRLFEQRPLHSANLTTRREHLPNVHRVKIRNKRGHGNLLSPRRNRYASCSPYFMVIDSRIKSKRKFCFQHRNVGRHGESFYGSRGRNGRFRVSRKPLVHSCRSRTGNSGRCRGTVTGLRETGYVRLQNSDHRYDVNARDGKSKCFTGRSTIDT